MCVTCVSRQHSIRGKKGSSHYGCLHHPCRRCRLVILVLRHTLIQKRDDEHRFNKHQKTFFCAVFFRTREKNVWFRGSSFAYIFKSMSASSAQAHLRVSGRAFPVTSRSAWNAVSGDIAVVAPFDQVGALQIDLKGKIVLAPCFVPATGQTTTSEQQIQWYQHHGAAAVVLPLTAAAIPPPLKAHRVGTKRNEASFNRGRRTGKDESGGGRDGGARGGWGAGERSGAAGGARSIPDVHPMMASSKEPAILGVFMEAVHIHDVISMLRRNLQPSSGYLIPAAIQRAEGAFNTHAFPLSDLRSTACPSFNKGQRSSSSTSSLRFAETSARIPPVQSGAAASAVTASTNDLPTELSADDDFNNGFTSASLTRDRMQDLEARIERTPAGALPTPMVIEFLWLKHRAEDNPRLDTLGLKGTGHGGVASMPPSLYTATIIIPLIVTGLVGGSDATVDIEAGIVSRRGILESLFCLGDVDLRRGPQRSWATSMVACCAVCSVRCFDAIYGWFVSGAPWYLFHFASLAAQVIFIWYIRSADVEQQLDNNSGSSANSTAPVTFGSEMASAGLVATCAASSPLRFVAAGVYSGMLFKEVCETCNMAAWLYRAPSSPVTELIQVSRSSPTAASIDMISGFSRSYKLWCILVAILPKLALAGALWFYGGAFILRAVNDSELILNTVAVTFINEIDDLLYTVLVPPDIDRLLADLPELEWMSPAPTGRKQTKLQRWSVALSVFAGQYLYAGIIIAMTFGSLVSACG